MQKKQSSFVTLISVFFFWGFVAASNDILIPVFKEELNLEQWQSQMISFAFYVAYTVGSVAYIVLSKFFKTDIINKLGYKNGIALGLVISSIGTFLFYPAAQIASFNLMITGLFIVGLGFSLQQTAANPLVINFGNKSKGSQRLSLAGGINNIGTTIGPLVVSYAIFGSVNKGSLQSIDSVKIPYLILGLAFLIVAILFKISSLPNKIEDTELYNETAIITSKKSVFAFPQLVLGMIAIFVYVGVEVATASNLPEFMKQKLNTPTQDIAPYVSLFWASLMVGRWTGAVVAFNLKGTINLVLKFIMPYLAFGVFLLANAIAGNNLKPFYLYVFIILIIIFADIFSRGNPAKQLLIFSMLGIISLIIAITASGLISVYAIISVGLFCSTLWPCIFTLAISGLGKYTNEGSSYLIMMIMGGGFISLLQGWVSGNNILGIQNSYLVGIICFVYLAWYAYKIKGIYKKQNLSLDIEKGLAH